MPRRHQTIAHLIQRDIASGELAPGAPLPTATELAERYRGSVDDLQLALQYLASNGLIILRDDGHAATVCQPPTQTHIMSVTSAERRKAVRSPEEEFDASARDVGLAPSHQTNTRLVPATPEIAGKLEISVGQQVIHQRSIHLTNETPSVLEDVYLARRSAADSEPAHSLGPELTLRALGFDAEGWIDTLVARQPNPDESDSLELPSDRPVIQHDRVVRFVRIDHEQVEASTVMYTRTVLAGDRNRLSYHHKLSNTPRIEAGPTSITDRGRDQR